MFGGSRSFAIRPRTLILIGALALGLGAWGISDHVGFLLLAERAEAQVVAVETIDRGEGFLLYRPAVRFSTPDGEVTATVAETYRPTVAGEILTVGFDPTSPNDVRLMDPRDRWILPLWMIAFGVITIAIGVRRRRGAQSGNA